ncbi:hypothetical protein [Methanimicrococcus hongohii]|uniref:hypothetical protein n=1 Tax=Methanimicrococcus hongohii TaxID=3028295 RepID=UPI00292ED175|nr:hypothetical protein [Methanimicrococcus sp. Hf6]
MPERNLKNLCLIFNSSAVAAVGRVVLPADSCRRRARAAPFLNNNQNSPLVFEN